MDSPKHWLPVTKTSTSRRHWLLTIPKFWNSLVMDESGCKGFGQVLWERERSTQVNLKKWTAMLLSAKRLKVPYHWTAWLWERGRDHIESPFFFFHLYFIKNPSPNSHTKPLSLSLICISSTSLSAIGFLSCHRATPSVSLIHSTSWKPCVLGTHSSRLQSNSVMSSSHQPLDSSFHGSTPSHLPLSFHFMKSLVPWDSSKSSPKRFGP